MEALTLLLPPYLRSLGYESESAIQLLRTVNVDSSARVTPSWISWRGIFEYLSCVEYARAVLLSLPSGGQIGGDVAVPARFAAAALVFFAQATLDNIAGWLTNELSLAIKGSHRQLHKNNFKSALSSAHGGKQIVEVIGRHSNFLKDLERFRQAWIHSLAGGANLYADRPPDQGGIAEIAVPMDPAIDSFAPNQGYLRRIEACRERNSGRWLYPIAEFANRFGDGTKMVCLDLLACSIASWRSEPPDSSGAR
jgi:hypothetical protein